MAYENYDRLHAIWSKKQRRNGGLARSSSAIRHPVYKIFLPNHPIEGLDILFPTTYHHGVAGGQARVIKAIRDSHGRFVKG